MGKKGGDSPREKMVTLKLPRSQALQANAELSNMAGRRREDAERQRSTTVVDGGPFDTVTPKLGVAELDDHIAESIRRQVTRQNQ